jgi:hypothetical protein
MRLKKPRLKQSIYPSVTLQGDPILGSPSIEAHMRSNLILTRIETLLLVSGRNAYGRRDRMGGVAFQVRQPAHL